MAAPVDIWLLGGTGDVGRRVAQSLSGRGGRVVLASRRARQQADNMANIGDDIALVDLDVTDAAAIDQIPAGAVVINLTEATPPPLARAVVDNGGRFIESSASPTYLARLEQVFSGGGFPGLAVLYAGVSPGLTNLMASALLKAEPRTIEVDICLEMGMGRHYGAAATEWFLRASGLPYPAIIDERQQTLRSGALSRRVMFDGDRRPRTALGYGFAEQLHIAQRHSLVSVRNFIALDPPWMTRALQGAVAVGLGGAIARNAPVLTRWMARLPDMGTTRTRITVQARRDGDRPVARVDIVTGDQAEATAAILAALGRRVAQPDAGLLGKILDITDVMTLDAAFQALVTALPDTRVRWPDTGTDAPEVNRSIHLRA